MRPILLTLALALCCGSAATAVPATASEANLVLRIALKPGPVQAGRVFVSTFRVTNTGPHTATNVTLQGRITGTDADGVVLGATPIEWGDRFRCSGTSARFRCVLGTLRRAETATLSIRLTAEGPGRRTAWAVVASNARDPRSRDNRASATIRVASGSG